MATWDGEINNDFSLAQNWQANSAPANGELVILNNGGLFNQPILASTDVFNVLGVNISAGTLIVNGDLAASTGFNITSTGEIGVASIGTLTGNVFIAGNGRLSLSGLLTGGVTNAGTGIIGLDISATGQVTGNVISSGDAVNRNIATTGISGNLEVTGGFFDNRGGVGGNTTVSGGELLLDFNSNLSNSGTVTVSGTGTLNVFAGDTVSSVVQTGGSIVGAGTLSTNTFTQSGGELAGIVLASGAKTLEGGSIAGLLTGGGATTVQNGTTTVTGTIDGNVIVAGGGVLRLDSATAVSGTITTTGSTISYADGMVEDSALVISSSDTHLEVLASDSAEHSGVISSSGDFGFEKTGGGTLLLSGVNTFTGDVTVSDGTLALSGGSAIDDSVGVVISGAATLRLDDDEDVGSISSSSVNARLEVGTNSFGVLGALDTLFAGVVIGSGTLFNDGSGTLTLTGDGSGFSGVIGATGTGSEIALTGSGITSAAGFGAETFNTFSTDGGALLSSNGVLVANGQIIFTGSEEIGAMTNSSATGLGTGSIDLIGAGTILTVNGTANALNPGGFNGLTGAIAGNGSLVKTGAGTLTLGGLNTYIGTTTVNGGLLDVTGSLASLSNIINAGGTLRVDGASLSDAATVTLNGSGQLSLAGSETIGALVPVGGTASVSLNGSTLTLAAQTGNLGLLTLVGSAAVDRMDVFLASSLANFSMAGLQFASWTEGTDIVTVTGNALANRLNGSNGKDTLKGGGGNDTLVGAAGNDIYVVEDAGDRVFETTTTVSNIDAGGLDTVLSSVSYNIGTTTGTSFVERLTLTGTGNTNATGNGLNNLLKGNIGNNILDGGTGSDQMFGGAGDDTYRVDVAGDRVFETTTTTSGIDTGGVDTVESAVSFNLGLNGGTQFVEKLTLTGNGNTSGTGNALNNLIQGNIGNNILNGGVGTDQLLGGAGNDTYFVDDLLDRVFETTTLTSSIDAGGIDTVTSSITYNLDLYASVRFAEHLTLTGTGNLNGTGNALGNRITGNDGANQLNGGLGNDTLIGGLGADRFVFNSALGANNIDRISDFTDGLDKIRLDDAIFVGLTVAGVLDPNAFVANASGQAENASQHIIYETDTGRLFYDVDGLGGTARVQFAVMGIGLAVDNTDFQVV